MSESPSLHRFVDHVDELDRQRFMESPDAFATLGVEAVLRDDGSRIGLAALADLAEDFRSRRGDWDSDRAASDRWLAPRLHSALPIARSTAGDREVWHWLAVHQWSDYVTWRWGARSVVAQDRWVGPINKQALARLWWGAELFRNGDDYAPAENAFLNQDLINSYLHRPLIRCRSFALGIVEILTDETGEELSSKKINDLARVLNLCTAGTPPEARVDYQADDVAAVLAWAASDAPVPDSWMALPAGPRARDTTETSVLKGRELARHGIELARRGG
jgi:hypothetical protein